MQAALRLVIAILIVIAAVLALSCVWQSHAESRRLHSEIDRNAQILADSFSRAAAGPLAERTYERLVPLAEDFSNRANLLGITIHAGDGRLLVASSRVAPLLNESPAGRRRLIGQTVDTGRAHARILDLGGERLHAYSAPVRVNRETMYVLGVYHGTGYMNDRIFRIWKLNGLRFIVLGLLVSLTTFLYFYLNVMAPIRRTAEWIKRVRLGEAPGREPVAGRFLGPVAREVSQMARSLAAAREAAEEEARLRQSSQSLWTPERLKEFVRTKLHGKPLFVVSNREPYQHVKKGKDIEVVVPPSGVVTAIEPVLNACGGTWIAEGNGDADRDVVDSNDRLRVPPDDPHYTLRRIWLTKEEEEGYYYGFSNEGLWPLCHVAHTRPTFRPEDWAAYETVNRRFADALVQEMEGTEEPCVLIQDYHFALLPKLIKERRPDARVTIFWHIPWPNPESFGICPWQDEVLGGMLGADIVGFHTQYHCNNFLQTVDRFLESRIDYEHFTVTREGHVTWVKPFPISIAFIGGPEANGAGSPAPDRAELLKPHGVSAELIGVGVDRLDYTKGILERFRSVETFLEKNPDYVGRFTFVELAAPSRSLISKYQEFAAEVEREVERINARFKAKNWKAILFLKKNHSHSEIMPFYRAAEVCLVTSLHDGMNLVAKEFVTARHDERGVLVLSQFTGAARELREALIINPYDILQTSEAIRAALEMPVEEQGDRMRRMRAVLKERNIYRWAADLIGEIAAIRIAPQAPSSAR